MVQIKIFVVVTKILKFPQNRESKVSRNMSTPDSRNLSVANICNMVTIFIFQVENPLES